MVTFWTYADESGAILIGNSLTNWTVCVFFMSSINTGRLDSNKTIQIPLFSIKHNTMFLAYIGKYTYNENMKKRRTYMCHLTRSNR